MCACICLCMSGCMCLCPCELPSSKVLPHTFILLDRRSVRTTVFVLVVVVVVIVACRQLDIVVVTELDNCAIYCISEKSHPFYNSLKCHPILPTLGSNTPQEIGNTHTHTFIQPTTPRFYVHTVPCKTNTLRFVSTAKHCACIRPRDYDYLYTLHTFYASPNATPS